MKNKCDDAVERLINRLEEPSFSNEEFQNFLNIHIDCSEILQEKYELWNGLQQLDVPSPTAQMSANFYESLDKEVAKEAKPKVMNLKTRTYSLNTVWKWSAVAAVFVLGLVGGKFFLDDNGSDSKNLVSNVDPVISGQLVSYDPSNSTSNRLEVVQNAKQLSGTDEKIFEALNQALLNDPNINVRLSAIESMLHFADHSIIREYLILAIPKQESPTVQIALADAMLFLQEKRSKNAFDQLLDSEDVEMDVKRHIQESLREIY